MEEKLYYTIEYGTQPSGGYCDELTGDKTITCYDIVDNIPKMIAEIESLNTKNSKEEIQFWLDNNGYEDKEFELVQL